jgi:hypothetical protein
MQRDLVELFSSFYDQPSNPDLAIPSGYKELPPKLLALFQKWNVRSLFDAGCGDRRWMRHNQFAEHGITYMGGDISVHVAEFCKQEFPELDIQHHDLTTDPFPAVDLLFSSDVAIHLSFENKIQFLKNFLSSNIKYLLMTTDYYNAPNDEITLNKWGFPFAHLNWSIAPWNFPAPLDIIHSDPEHTKALYLWSKQQVQEAVERL